MQEIANNNFMDRDALQFTRPNDCYIPLLLPLIDLFELVILLPVGRSASYDDDEDRNYNGNAIYPLNTGCAY
ncbi:hypothetical protein HG531_004489 [Fusarium graminearum]|nr:hypothetical protein HG531_004489 [Fusarium graminearum]